MMTNKKINVLKRIAIELNKKNITWALGASMLLYFKGIISEFKDIDIMVIDDDIDQVKKILLELGELQSPNLSSKYKTRVFLEFIIDNVDVDVMAGFSIVNGDNLIDCSLKPEEIIEYYDLDGVKIPLQSIEIWCRYYELMGRESRVEAIKKVLSK